MFTAPGFLDRATCGRIRRAMDAGSAEPADVLGDGIQTRLDVRRASNVDIEPAVIGDVERRLDAARESIAEFFGVALTGREGASFLRYPDGGFYKPHRDRGVVAEWPAAAVRQIAVVLFLNSAKEGGDADSFSGGVLRLYPPDREPIDIVPVQGTLVAFPSTMLHEVTRVGDAVRDVVVDWFY